MVAVYFLQLGSYKLSQKETREAVNITCVNVHVLPMILWPIEPD